MTGKYKVGTIGCEEIQTKLEASRAANAIFKKRIAEHGIEIEMLHNDLEAEYCTNKKLIERIAELKKRSAAKTGRISWLKRSRALRTAQSKRRGEYIIRQRERIAELEAQLPPEMKDCTIQFIECPKGHGRLMATNWTNQDCWWCRIAELKEELRKVRGAWHINEGDEWMRLFGRLWYSEEYHKARIAELEAALQIARLMETKDD